MREMEALELNYQYRLRAMEHELENLRKEVALLKLKEKGDLLLEIKKKLRETVLISAKIPG